MIAAGGAKELHDKCINITDTTFSEYYTLSRYEPFKKIIDVICEMNLNTSLDLATSSGHFVYLAKEKGLDCYGCDLELLEKDKSFFKDRYNKDCLFYYDINDLHILNNKYDIITNFHLTHIFDKESFLYLLKVLSNKCSYVFLHISEENIQNIQEYNFITIINIYRFKINMHNINNENWVLLKFNQVEYVEKFKKYIRPDYLITLSD